MKHTRKTVTGGGSSLGNRSKRPRFGKGLLGFAAAAAVALACFGTVAAQAVTQNASPVADTDTHGDYTSVLGADESTQYNGRVWTDKSVSTGDMSYSGDAGNDSIAKGDSDFLIAYSLLSTSTNESGRSGVPVDVVFVIDNSNSMTNNYIGRQTRLQATVDAVNASIADLMASNEDSRIAVVLYGNQAETLLPLGHYEPMWGGDYVTFTSSRGTTTFTASGNHQVSMSSNDRGTNIQVGVDQGMDILRSAQNIGEGVDKHVPALILLSDGQPTYSSDSQQWWNPANNAGSGNGQNSNNAHVFKIMLTAQYGKQQVNAHYGVTDPTDPYACKVYTIGMGVGNNSYAELSLDPSGHLDDRWDDVAQDIRSAWQTYNRNYYNTPTLDGYTFRHPQSGDVTTCQYNNGYYTANNAEDVTNVFDEITSTIITSRPQVPTQVGDNPETSGSVIYTDPLGEYMQVDDVKAMLYCGTLFENAGKTENDDGSVTYKFSGTVHSEVYGDKDAGLISITVSTGENGSQTVTIDVPAAAIPVRINSVDVDSDGNVTNEVKGAYPLRVFYGVSLQDGIADKNGNVVGNVSSDYITDNTDEQTGKVNFYANKYTKGGNGDALVTFTPSEDNPFYFLQEDTPIYVRSPFGGYSRATNIDDSQTYYIPVSYYDGTTLRNEYEPRLGSSLGDRQYNYDNTQLDGRGYYLPEGSARFADASDFNANKGAGNNPTGTSESKRHLTMTNGVVTIALGNNGRLQLNSPATLNVTKQVEVSGGVAAPADQEFRFTITASTKADAAIQATVTTPGDPETTSTQQISFDGTGKGTFTLKAGQTISIPGMANTEYTVTETEPGNGFTLTGIEGGTADPENRSTSGTIATKDASVVFTNTFAAKGTLVGADYLEVTKSLTGRGWTDGDSFHFTLAADMNDETTAAAVKASYITLPGNAVGIDVTNKNDHKASFGDITFTNTGKFKFLVAETAGASDNGINYDTTPRVVTVTVSPSQTPGQLDVKVDSITTQDGAESSLTFTNSYEPNPVELSGQYALKAQKTIDGRDWIPSDEFTFTLTRNGVSQTKTIAAGSTDHTVTFDSITITDEMMGDKDEATFTYEIKEKQSANELRDDTHTATVTVTVKDNGEGALVVDSIVYDNTDAPNDVDKVNTDIAAFTNYYDGGTVTYGDGDALLGGNKTVEDPSGFYEIADGDFGFYMVAQNANNPLPPVGNGVTHTTFGTNPERPAAYVTNSGSQVAAAAGNDTAVYDFGKIEFTSANMSDATPSQDGTTRTKSFVYYIREAQAKDIAGMSYDGTVYAVTFVVTENLATGEMTVSPSAVQLTGDEGENPSVEMNALNFTNTVNTGKLDAQLNLYKTLQGRPFDVDDEFVFDVTVTSSNPEQAVDDMPKPAEAGQGAGSVTVSDIAEQSSNSYSYTVTVKPGATPASPNTFTINGGSFAYTHTGTYTFVVSEVKGSDTTIDYDDTRHTIVVTIGQTEENNQSVLTRSVTMDGEPVAEGTTTTVDFENVYNAKPVEATLSVQKSLDGREWKTGDNFAFNLDRVNDGAPMPEGNGDVVRVQGTDGGTASISMNFGSIKYEKSDLGGAMSKTFQYSIHEVTPSPNPSTEGVTYDTHYTYVDVTVVDDGTGQLKVTDVVYDNSASADTGDAALTDIAAFTNTYKAGSTDLKGAADLSVTKTLAGRPWQQGDSFTFTLAIDENDQATKDAYEAGNIALPSNASGITIDYADPMVTTKAFGDITFKTAGTYKFVVTEQASTDTSIHNDADPDRTIVVEVKDNLDGTMIATVNADQSDNLSFTNTYVSTLEKPVDTSALFTKVLDGREWAKDDSFTFSITPGKGAPTPVDAEGNPVTRVTVGYDDVADEKDADGNAYATFGFGTIEFTQAMMKEQAEKTFTYTVKETSQSGNGITVDGHECTVTITVKDDFKGTLTATVSAPGNTFTNTYNSTVDYSAAVGFQIEKTLDGRDIHQNDFRFSFVPTGDNAQAAAELLGITTEGVKNIGTTEAQADGQNVAVNKVPVQLGDNLTFTQEDEGTYTYLVTETKGGGNGYTNDDKPVTVTISIADNDKGVLTVTTTAVKDGAGVSKVTVTSDAAQAKQTVTLPFTNIYKATGTLNDPKGGTSIVATKTLSGRDMTDREFKFQVLDNKNVVVATGENVGNQIVFTRIDYDMDKIAAAVADGTATDLGNDTYQYAYTVHEVTDGFADNGLSVKLKDQQVTVTVKDTGSGTLDVTASANSTNPLVFENLYETNKVPLSVNGKKVIDPGDGNNPPTYADLKDVYTFKLEPVTEGAPMPDDATAQMDDQGNITFGPIDFTLDKVWPEETDADTQALDARAGAVRTKTFEYRVTESGSVDYMTNDPQAVEGKTFSITVTDDGRGHLTAVVDGDASAFTFTNTYTVTTEESSPTGEGQLTITKDLTGRQLKDGDFDFQLTAADGTVASSGKNNENGVISLSAVKFAKPGNYSYTLSEVDPNEDDGVKYDTDVYSVIAKVSDNGTGKLDVEWVISMPDGSEVKTATFENSYAADPTSFSFAASKKLVTEQGLPLTMSDDQFTFELADAEGNVLQTKKSNANGQITFDKLDFDAVGTYEYKVSEVKGSEDAGITYDDTVYTVKVTVADDYEGSLYVSNVDYGEGNSGVTFTNTYAATEFGSITFGATKKLEGRDLKAGEFSFELLGPDGKVIATATNAADGSVVFDEPVGFATAGTYSYRIREVLPEDDDSEKDGIQKDGVTYDETVWTATVNVTDDYQGALHATVSYGNGAELPSFVNTYVAPPKIPQTGDTTNMVLPLVLAVGGVALVAGALTVARRRSK